MIAYLASDLLWGTRIKSTAEALGIAARPVRDLGMLEARLADSEVRGLVVDLEAPLETALALIERAAREPLHAGGGSIRIVAFGPHVAVDALEGAKRAGAGVVMARGAFAARLPEILGELESGAAERG